MSSSHIPTSRASTDPPSNRRDPLRHQGRAPPGCSSEHDPGMERRRPAALLPNQSAWRSALSPERPATLPRGRGRGSGDGRRGGYGPRARRRTSPERARPHSRYAPAPPHDRPRGPAGRRRADRSRPAPGRLPAVGRAGHDRRDGGARTPRSGRRAGRGRRGHPAPVRLPAGRGRRAARRRPRPARRRRAAHDPAGRPAALLRHPRLGSRRAPSRASQSTPSRRSGWCRPSHPELAAVIASDSGPWGVLPGRDRRGHATGRAGRRPGRGRRAHDQRRHPWGPRRGRRPPPAPSGRGAATRRQRHR